jgi:ribosomal-protein-alanine N-acetyltransferase
MNELQTKILIIRYFEENDYNNLYEYLSDKDVVYFEPYEPYSLEQSIQESKYRAECHDFYAVCLKDSNKLIGNLYLGKRDFDSCEIGAKRIIAECNPENEHS